MPGQTAWRTPAPGWPGQLYRVPTGYLSIVNSYSMAFVCTASATADAWSSTTFVAMIGETRGSVPLLP